jgi:lipopolysaccharide export system permease protein
MAARQKLKKSSGVGRVAVLSCVLSWRGGDRAVTMGSIDRYIFRTTLASFALVLISLTGVIWITQALRGIDLMTSQGQTIVTFLGVTSLVIPALVLIISPIALMIAISHTLNKLATDSEIIVMNAAGFSPFRLFRPFLYATCAVALLVAFIASYLAPDGMRRLKQWDAEITADVLANILQPGRFAQLDQNLTIRIRERQPGGLLVGIFIDDRRDPKERISIVADHGTVVKSGDGSFLILEDGNMERFEAGKRDPALVAFGRYAFDMSKFSNQGHDVALGIRERYLWELLAPAEDDQVYKQIPGQFRAELHDRFLAPIYPFAFAALTFAFLGAPRTTRQSRNFSIGSSILAVFGLRMAGFACSVMAVKSPLAPALQYLMLAAAIGGGIWIIVGGIVLEPPAALIEAINKSNARLLRLFRRPATA